MKKIGYLLILLSVLLLVITSLGQWTSLGNYKSAEPLAWERFDPNLVESTHSYSDLLKASRVEIRERAALSEQEKMYILYDMVTNRFTHNEAKHNLFSDWILFLGGQINPVFSHIYDVNLLTSKGYSLLCDQSSYMLLRLALDNNIRARHVGLYGHVVMEAWYESDWHLFDPDLEVVPVDASGDILSVEELAQNSTLLNKYYGPHSATEIVGSRENNTYMSYPEGSWFEWKSNVLAYLEKTMEILKFIIPFALLILGIRLTIPKRTLAR